MFGSKLVEKLWETTTEKGIGSLLKPWQIRREGIANLQNERNKMLVIAQTEQDIENIKKGNIFVSLNDIGNPKLITSKKAALTLYEDKNEPHIDIGILTQALNSNLIANEIQKEINISNALLVAEEILSTDQSEPKSESIEDDWLFRWRDSASNSTSEKLQDLWGRVLAGELKSPGSYSLRTIEFIKNLTQKEAYKIQKILSYILFGRIIISNETSDNFSNDYLNENLNFDFLSEMQSLGVIAGVESLGLQSKFKSAKKESYLTYYVYDQKVMIVTHENPEKNLIFNVIILTPLGKELLTLCKAAIDHKYIEHVIGIIKKQGFTVSVADVIGESEDGLRYVNAIVV